MYRSKLPSELDELFQCKECDLSNNGPIHPRGNFKARTLFLGEAPGKEEVQEDLFFCGPSGIKATDMAHKVGLSLDKHFFHWNCLLCRPVAPTDSGKEHLTPTAIQLSACEKKLRSILYAHNPELIVTVGAIAAKQILNFPINKISNIVGNFFTKRECRFPINGDIFVMYHPAYILRNPSMENKWKLQFIKLRDYMIGADLLK